MSEPYTITISTLATGNSRADHASYADMVARTPRSCAARALARQMVASGLPDGPVEARGIDGSLRYTVRSLHAFAKFTITENPRPHVVRWVDMKGIWSESENES